MKRDFKKYLRGMINTLKRTADFLCRKVQIVFVLDLIKNVSHFKNNPRRTVSCYRTVFKKTLLI